MLAVQVVPSRRLVCRGQLRSDLEVEPVLELEPSESRRLEHPFDRMDGGLDHRPPSVIVEKTSFRALLRQIRMKVGDQSAAARSQQDDQRAERGLDLGHEALLPALHRLQRLLVVPKRVEAGLGVLSRGQRRRI